MKKAGIIGGSGFIGSYITKTFLNHGYQVKVSATDITREDKYEHLMMLNHIDNLYISELDVTNKSRNIVKSNFLPRKGPELRILHVIS